MSPGGPYPVSYRALVPKRSECVNLLVPVCLASTHIAYGSIRMEPVFLILGQSSATAAALAVEKGTDVQDVDYAQLRKRLLADGQVLELPRPAAKGLSAAKFPGVVVDDEDAELRGEWKTSAVMGPFIGKGYRHDGDAAKGEKSAVFRANLLPGRYEACVAYSSASNPRSIFLLSSNLLMVKRNVF